MSADTELLIRYVDEGSEVAFAELVRVHINLVYFAALRQMGGDTHRAQEVTQIVFTDLARKAGALTARNSCARPRLCKRSCLKTIRTRSGSGCGPSSTK